MKKKSIALLIVLAMMLSIIPAAFAAEAASGTCGENASWVLDRNGKLTVSGTGNIEDMSFDGNTAIVELVIEEGITDIGGAAFRGCTNLKSVSFPESLEGFNMSSFGNCTSLESIEIPANVGFLPEGVFGGCTNLKTVTLHEGLKGLGRSALAGCTSLESITLPNSLTDIDTMAFYHCTSLKSIHIPENVEMIDSFVFEDCSSLTGIWVDENNPYFYNDSRGVLFRKFGNQILLKAAPGALSGSYTIPENINRVDNYAFQGCAKLKEVTIPDSLPQVSTGMFQDCTGLESVTISAGVEEIWNMAFAGCTSLKNISFEGDAPDISDYVYTDDSGSTDHSSFVGVTATCYYPRDNETWTEDILKDYGGDLTWVSSFVDVKPGNWYEPAVKWAADAGVTSGVGNSLFAPGRECSRAEVVSFLWRAKNCPAPKSTESSFVDIKPSDWYYDAVLWATEEGITVGTSDTEFSPNGICTRAECVSFLWRAAGYPMPKDATNSFADVAQSAWYYEAALWAAEEGIAFGTSDTEFSPSGICSRAECVTFLHRYFIK